MKKELIPISKKRNDFVTAIQTWPLPFRKEMSTNSLQLSFFFYINVNLKLNKIQYSVPSIAEKDMTSSGSGYERHLQFL